MKQYRQFTGPGYDVNKVIKRGLGDQHDVEKGKIIYRAMRGAGVNFVCWLADTWLSAIHLEIMHDKDPKFTQVSVCKEDEGMAICVGASLAGKIPAIVMEGSGIGNGALVLSRFCLVAQIPILLVSSHTSGIGEIAHYHAETRTHTEPILDGLNIPYYILEDVAQAERVFKHARLTLESQRVPVAILLARPSVWKDGDALWKS